MVISQKAKNIFNRLYIWCVADNFIVNYDLISPVGTMHRAPTLTFPDQVEDRFVYFLGYN